MQFEEWASKNLKDRYFSLIELLQEKGVADECTVPFVPYVGANYCDAKPKILIIGKATYGWGKGDGGQQGSGTLNDVLDKDDHDRWKYLIELPEEFIEGEVIPYYGGEKRGPARAFWRRIYQLAGKCLLDRPISNELDPQVSETCFRSIAWSNVFKDMKGWVSKGERLKIAERTRRGRLRKAQEGKIVGNGTAPYGFYYEDDHYHVDPERMIYVQEIFERAAAGDSLYSIAQHLNNIGAPTPKGKKWHTSTLRNIILSDTYLGSFYWGKEKYSTDRTSKVVDGEKIYVRKVVKEEQPESDWISIPVPDSGISPDIITRARESLKVNIKSVSRSGGRVWELSGGVGICSECGRHMVAHTSRNTAKRTYYYYRCSSNREHQACPNRKNRPARDLEMQVTDAIVGTFQEETWGAFVKNACDQKIAELRRLGRGGTEGTKERLAGRISALEKQKARTRHLYTIGDFTLPEYEEDRDQLQDQIETLRQELSKVDDLEGEIRRWEELRKTLLGVNNPLEGLPSGPEETAAKDRQGFYRKAGLIAEVGEETLQISLGMDRISVSNDESVSGVIAAPAPVGVPGSLSLPRS